MNDLNEMSGIASLDVASVATTKGTVCVLNAEGKLVPAAADSGGQLFVTLCDALERGTLVSAAVVGNQPGTVVVRATAGTYVAGAEVYVGANGVVTTTKGRVIGTVSKGATLSGEGAVAVWPQHVPLAAS